MNANNIEVRQHTTVSLLLAIDLTLISGLRYLDQVYQLDMIKMEELQPSLMYTAYIYQTYANNLEAIAAQHCEEYVKKGFVEMKNISEGGHKFQQARKKFSPTIKNLIDQMEYVISMDANYKGLRRIIQAC